jgi:hypothetical protein
MLSFLKGEDPSDTQYYKAHASGTIEWNKIGDEHTRSPNKIFMLRNAKLTKSMKFKFYTNAGGDRL